MPFASSTLAPRAVWLGLATLLALAALALHGPITQPAGYHLFADERSAFGLPNLANVLSNLPFLLIGVWAWRRLRAAGPALGDVPRAGAAWRAFAVSIAFTALGSTLYHWAPNNNALMLDRLPIAWACASLLCAFLAERVHAGFGRAPVLAVALLLGTASVVWWWVGERQGAGDLRAYLAMQFLPMLLVPLALLLRVRRQGAGPTSADAAWWSALVLYAAAKAFEIADHSVLDALQFISGHTIKHLLAAVAAWLLLRAACQLKTAAQATG
jgi:Ceramidase